MNIKMVSTIEHRSRQILFCGSIVGFGSIKMLSSWASLSSSRSRNTKPNCLRRINNIRFFIHSGGVRAHDEMYFMRRDSSNIEQVISNELLKNNTTREIKFKIWNCFERKAYMFLVRCPLVEVASMRSGESLESGVTNLLPAMILGRSCYVQWKLPER